LKRKKAQHVVMLAEDENIISISDFVALDSVLCKTFDVLTGEMISIPVLD
jgi:hypothetical protein